MSTYTTGTQRCCTPGSPNCLGPLQTPSEGSASLPAPREKLLDVGLEGAWLLLWLRPPLPDCSHPLQTGMGRTGDPIHWP